MNNYTPLFLAVLLSFAAQLSLRSDELEARWDGAGNTLSVFRDGEKKAVLTQVARPDFRPYLHPIVAPDGKGVLTEYSPGHHKHQTGLYWGFTRVNGRDYFHHPGGDYWRRVSAKVLKPKGSSVQWQTIYEMLDAKGEPQLVESQAWSMEVQDGEYVLDLNWSALAKTDITIGKYNYGGLFLRMPWKKGIDGRVFNSSRQANSRAEGQRSVWVDVGMKVPGRDDHAHIAIFDHPRNPGFPTAWRVDNQLGIGPASSRNGDWKIPKGRKASFRHRLLVYTGKLNDAELTKKWSGYSGHGYASVLWGLAQQEGRKALTLAPFEALKKMKVQEGFKVNVFTAEPMITQPMAFCWDSRGRMWIAENRDYETRGRGFSNSGDSRILILEDTDRDGMLDSRKVFLEGVAFPAAVAVGFDGLWLGAPPNLLYVPDRNGDDKADVEDIEVRLAGWGIRDRHETLNSFHWGPDGWLYGCQGFATPSRVGKPAGKGKIYRHKDPFPRNTEFEGKPVDINGGVWRYHPLKDRFEVVAHGFSNPWGIDYDAKGQLFISACVIPHLWHVIPGGIYHRQGGRHFNPYVYSDIRTITNHRHRSAHGGARVYLSDAFPEKYRNRLFMANIHEHAVLTDILEPKGSGFVGHHGDDFLLANDARWIGFSVEIGPDGGVYILDWHDGDICGKAVLNKDTGRVYRIMPEKSNAVDWKGRYGDLRKLGDEALARLQISKSSWHARRARVILQNRAAKGRVAGGAREALVRIFTAEPNADYRLRAMWALHISGGLEEAQLLKATADRDQHIRAWAVQLLCEDGAPSKAAQERFAQLSRDDASPVVRLYLASALQRLAKPDRWVIATGLSSHAGDANDHNLPKMIWYGIEPAVPEDPEKAVALASGSKIPLLTRYIARRLTAARRLEALVEAIGKAGAGRKELLLGMRDGLDGRNEAPAPEGWTSVFIELEAAGGETASIARQLEQRFGGDRVVKKMLSTLNNSRASTDDRIQALRGLAGRKRAELRPRLLALLDEKPLRSEAIRSMAAFDDNGLGEALLERYATLSVGDKLEAIHALAARPGYGGQLTGAIKSGAVPRRDVPAYVARLLRRVVGSGFVEVWGPVDALPAAQAAAFKKYKALLSDEALLKANPGRGRVVFERTCSSCHKLYGGGGLIGPDITGANRTNLDYLLGNILTPSAIIQDAYRMQMVLMRDGRLYSGIPAVESERLLELRVANQAKPVALAKSQIASREIAPVSMMPEGLLANLSDAEVLDLVAYLRKLKQVPLPKK
ncbi:MAG: dehydrogenase [Planctomycetes bacterium]|nr:dehydrogenase [Planctomycetota bacterium]